MTRQQIADELDSILMVLQLGDDKAERVKLADLLESVKFTDTNPIVSVSKTYFEVLTKYHQETDSVAKSKILEELDNLGQFLKLSILFLCVKD